MPQITFRRSAPPAAALALLLSGCASIPDVEVTYYLPKASVTLTLLQTLQCSKATPPQLIAGYSVTSAVSYASDLARRQQISLQDLDGTYSDIDLKFGLTEDGRLTAVNTTATGQGEAIARSAITLLGSVLPLLVPGPHPAPSPSPSPNVCEVLKNWAKADTPASLTYVATIAFANGMPTVPPQFLPMGGSDVLAESLRTAGGVPMARISVGAPEAVQAPASTSASAPRRAGVLVATRTAPVTLQIDLPPSTSASKPVPIWSGTVVIPLAGEIPLPIGHGAAFGQQTFELALAESGAIKTLRYAKSTGIGSALNAANAALIPFQPPSLSDQTAAINAQADLLAAQQRLVKCKADPTSC